MRLFWNKTSCGEWLLSPFIVPLRLCWKQVQLKVKWGYAMLSVYFVTTVDRADIRMGKGFSYPTGNGPDCGATKRTNIDPHISDVADGMS